MSSYRNEGVAMKYSEFIKADEGFQYSINLQYDLNKLPKINGYIPTNMSMEIIKNYLMNVYYDSKERATVLIGPYGKGKSHLLLILLAILSLKENIIDEENSLSAQQVISELISKVDNIDNEAGKIISELNKQNERIIPVVINSNHLDLNQAFLIALKDALGKEGFEDLIPNTYFDAVKKIIATWRNNFKETYDLFQEKLKKFDLSIREFNGKINNCDERAYEIFKEIYPCITSGMEFNPLINSDIVRLYEEVNSKICEKSGYRGMYIVFDEFSKFLEASVTRNSAKDIKIIQDFAELANRSGKNQLHFTCITHKPINDYISNLPKEKIDAWRAVEGRFKEIYFTSSSQQNYELIANAIKKDREQFEQFIDRNKGRYEEVLSQCLRIGLFDDVPSYEDVVVKGCFPLNPVSAYTLTRVSERVAQNERTLFTFLAKDEKGSLCRFINKHEANMEFLTIEYIYDYFQLLFKKEVFNENVHTIWLKADSALQRANEKNERKIIKAITIIYIVNELDKLAPIDFIIMTSLGLNKDAYNIAINTLLNNHILMKKKSNGFYSFLPSSNLNINNDIQIKKETKVNNVNNAEVLESIVDLGYTIPKKYNDEYSMVRFFRNIFINAEQFLLYDNALEIINEYKADGIILNLVYSQPEEKEKAIQKLKDLKNKRILLCIPNKPFNKEEDLKEYKAIQYLKADEEFISQDDYAIQELKIFEADVVESIENYIKNCFDVQYGNCKYYGYLGEERDIRKASQLNRKVSDICSSVFNRTPVINNELINKMKISSPILKARNKILEYIFEEMDSEGLVELQGKGPEATIFRATIKNKGLLGKRLSEKDINLNTVLDKMEKFLLAAEGKKECFSKIYEDLYGEDCGFGLRAGIIPVYLALKMKDHKEDIIIYFGERGDKEIPLSVETLNSINNAPEKYFILLEKGTNEKVNYIKKLDSLFKEYRNTREIGYNRFSGIVISMQNWIQSLPKFTREFEIRFREKGEVEVSKEIKILRRELLKFDINPREFLFDRMMRKILKEDSIDKCLEKIKDIKIELDTHINETKSYLIEKTKDVFCGEYKGSLGQAIKIWYSDLNEAKKKHLYDTSSNRVLNFVSNLQTDDENVIIEKLANIVSGLNIEDWNDEIVKSYLLEIKRVKDTVESYTDEIAVERNSSYLIGFNVDGDSIERTFECAEISQIGSTLLNDVEQIFEDYGDSIDTNEKRNILMKLLQSYM